MIALLQFTFDVSNILLLTFAGTIIEPPAFVNFCDKPSIKMAIIELFIGHNQASFFYLLIMFQT